MSKSIIGLVLCLFMCGFMEALVYLLLSYVSQQNVSTWDRRRWKRNGMSHESAIFSFFHSNLFHFYNIFFLSWGSRCSDCWWCFWWRWCHFKMHFYSPCICLKNQIIITINIKYKNIESIYIKDSDWKRVNKMCALDRHISIQCETVLSNKFVVWWCFDWWMSWMNVCAMTMKKSKENKKKCERNINLKEKLWLIKSNEVRKSKRREEIER